MFGNLLFCIVPHAFDLVFHVSFVVSHTSVCKLDRSEMMTTTKRLTMVMVPRMIISSRRNMANPLLIESLKKAFYGKVTLTR